MKRTKPPIATAAEPEGEGDDHMRNLKAALKKPGENMLNVAPNLGAQDLVRQAQAQNMPAGTSLGYGVAQQGLQPGQLGWGQRDLGIHGGLYQQQGGQHGNQQRCDCHACTQYRAYQAGHGGMYGLRY